MSFDPAKCQICKKPVFANGYFEIDIGETYRYFHPECFKKLLGLRRDISLESIKISYNVDLGWGD